MKIISGKHKGRLIRMPQGIRPTQNKVRKALFDILGDIEGLSFLELFAGSGAVGFEAVSRGISELTLVEPDHDCLLAIRKNIESLKIKACSLYPQEAGRALETLRKEGRKFDIIFFDPPYYDDTAKKILQALGGCDILNQHGFAVVQHFKKDILPDKAGELILFRQSRYGDTILSFYKSVRDSKG